MRFLFSSTCPSVISTIWSTPRWNDIKGLCFGSHCISALEWFVLIGHSLFKSKCSINTECGPFSGLFCQQPGTLVYKICMCLIRDLKLKDSNHFLWPFREIAKGQFLFCKMNNFNLYFMVFSLATMMGMCVFECVSSCLCVCVYVYRVHSPTDVYLEAWVQHQVSFSIASPQF